MIDFQQVCKYYQLGDHRITALENFNLHIEAGEMVAIMGPSGSGKSTAMNIIGLLDHPSSGQYFLNNKAVAHLNSDQLARLRNCTIGFIFQSFFLLPRLTALQNVSLPLNYRRLQPQEINAHASACLDKVHMKAWARHKPNQLSGGQQQRVAIARALVGEPEIILADEPTGALDSKTSQEVMDLLIRLNKEEKKTVIIITHDAQIAKQCPRIIRVKDGQIIDN